jgi:hypothetical protein
MARLIAPVLLALLPWTINAEPIYVDYEGEVRSLHAEEGGPSISDFRVGQQIKGRLTVHTEPAIPDLGGGPGFALYFDQKTDFVVSDMTALLGSSPWDSVKVQPYAPKPQQYFQVTDRSVIDLDNETRFSIHVEGIPDEINDDAMWQAFKAEPKKDGSTIYGSLLRIKNALTSGVLFAFNRVSVTPRSCMAP